MSVRALRVGEDDAGAEARLQAGANGVLGDCEDLRQVARGTARQAQKGRVGQEARNHQNR